MAYEKDPTEKKDYGVDWSNHLLVDGVDVAQTITTSTWTIEPTGELAKTSPEGKTGDNKGTYVRLQAGVAGKEYKVTNHVVTSTGQEFDRSFVVTVVDL